MAFEDYLDPEFRAIYEALKANRSAMNAVDLFFIRPHPEFGYTDDERAEAFALIFAGVLHALKYQAAQKGASTSHGQGKPVRTLP